MNEADALADLFKTQATPQLPKPASAPAAASPVEKPAKTAKQSGVIIDLALAFGSMIAIMAWISAAGLIINALTTGGAIADIVTLEIAATLIIFGGLFVLALAARLLVALPVRAPHVTMAAAVGLGLALGIAAQSYAVLATWLSNHLADPINPAARGTILMLIGGSTLLLFQTAAEEFFFRGWIQPVLTKYFGAIAGIAGASIAFSLMHVYGGTRDPMSIVNLTLGGLFFGVLAWRTGGLAAPMAAHFAWNWSEQILFGLDPNPGVATFGALTDHDIIGSALWGGSEEGLNSSLAITFVLIALILPIARWTRRAAQPV
jgi:uncharacterized protein